MRRSRADVPPRSSLRAGWAVLWLLPVTATAPPGTAMADPPTTAAAPPAVTAADPPAAATAPSAAATAPPAAATGPDGAAAGAAVPREATEKPPGGWLADVLPESLLRPGPKGLLWWQWVALPVAALLAVLAGLLLGWLSAKLLCRLAHRTKAEWDDAFVAQLRGPLTAAWSVALVYLARPWLALPPSGDAVLGRVLGGALYVIFFWTLARAVGVLGQAVLRSPWAAGRPGLGAIVPLVVRVGRIGVWVLAAISVLSLFGYPVASLLAGVGIGGLILALAAQKTAENLIGSVAIGVDQPFRPGDFVKVEDVVGTVETVGLRSTRIRTLDRTLVTYPNGRLADTRTESLSVRDRIRLHCRLGLVFGTTAEQMRRVLEGVETLLRGHPKIWPDRVVVRFEAIGASSLDVQVMAWFATTDWDEFQAIRQEVLLGFLEVIEKAGTSLAFPTRTVHVSREKGA